jgi:hypothetical protein
MKLANIINTGKQKKSISVKPSGLALKLENRLAHQDDPKIWESIIKKTIDHSVQSLTGTSPRKIEVSLSELALLSERNAIDWLGGPTEMVTALCLNISNHNVHRLTFVFRPALLGYLSNFAVHTTAHTSKSSVHPQEAISFEFANLIGHSLVTAIAELYHIPLSYSLPIAIVDNAQTVMQIAWTEVLDQKGDSWLLTGDLGIIMSNNSAKSPIILICSSPLVEIVAESNTGLLEKTHAIHIHSREFIAGTSWIK